MPETIIDNVNDEPIVINEEIITNEPSLPQTQAINTDSAIITLLGSLQHSINELRAELIQWDSIHHTRHSETLQSNEELKRMIEEIQRHEEEEGEVIEDLESDGTLLQEADVIARKPLRKWL